MNRYLLAALAFLVMLPAKVSAEIIDLKVGLVRAGGQEYFVDLLEQSLRAQGHEVNIEVIGNMPQKRMIHMMQNDELSLTWLVKSKARDDKLVAVDVGITNGLIGHRILLIPQGTAAVYANVNSIEDFRQLDKSGVFGVNWFDVAVWKLNQLRFIEKDGDWQSTIYNQIAAKDRGIDYFSRGFFEVIEEAEKNPDLEIEPHLMFIYERDFQFYLSKHSSHYHKALKTSLEAARDSGLMDKLIKKHWALAFDTLKPQQRRIIMLKTPLQ